MKGCRMFVKGHRRKRPVAIFLPCPCCEQDPVQSGRFSMLLRCHFLPGQVVIVLGVASSLFGTNAMFPFLLMPDATFLRVSWTEVLCSCAGKHQSSSLFPLLNGRHCAIQPLSFTVFLCWRKRARKFSSFLVTALWLLGCLFHMAHSFWHSVFKRTDRWWILNNSTLPKQRMSSQVSKAPS